MKIVTHALLLVSEKELSNICSSPAHMESDFVASSSSMQPPGVLLPKKPPQRTLYFG
jgi:hypothetical protein